MSLNERIERVNPYFILFNISAEEDAIYVVAKFPENWTIPDRTALKSTYNVEIAPMNNGICFATEIKNGTDCVFDALDYVIKFNRCVEERVELLKAKIKELQTLFSKEDLEKLKTLTFVFDEPKKRKSQKKVQEQVPAELVSEKESAKTVEQEKTDGNKEELPEDGGLMSFAKNIAEV